MYVVVDLNVRTQVTPFTTRAQFELFNAPITMSLSSSTSLNIDNEGVSNNGKKPLKEGPVQMTSLSTLLSFHRYYFLYQDTLFVSKQKGPGSFKLKEKLRLSDVWVASSNTVDSFLLGWPMTNYLLHFRNNEEKEEWFEMLGFCIQQNLKPIFTMISMDINVRGRKQTIRRRIENGKKSGELVVETANDLALPNTSYELKLVVGDSSGKSLQGPENVYAVIMHEIRRTGIRISESQKQALDTFPMLNCRLVLSTMKSTKTSTPMQFVNSIKKKVLHRMDSRSLLGKELDAATPPQTIMTIVDHLKIFGCETEGIFRKSPKQSTFKELRTELEKGLVPDLNKYSTHVLASMLKEYLRSIPGKILQSSNYDMWMKEVVDEEDLNKKTNSAKNLLSLLPSPHLMLLSNVLKLLAKISASPSSKMTSSALSVCLGPSFLESTDQIEGGKKIPPLVEFLINHAAEVVPGFNSDCVFSILQTVDHNSNVVTTSSLSSDEDNISQKTPIIEEIDDVTGEEADDVSQSSLSDSASVNSVAQAPSSSRIPSSTHDLSSNQAACSSSTASPQTSSISLSSQSVQNRQTVHSFNPCLPSSTSNDSSSNHRPKIPSSPFSKSSLMTSDSEDDFDEEKEQNLNDALKMLLLKKQATDVSPKESSKEPINKMEERRSGDTPRSPCLKRIHFQRTQEAQQRSASKQSSSFSYGNVVPPSTKPTCPEPNIRESEVSSTSNGKRVSLAVASFEQIEAIHARKESKEEATQTVEVEQQQQQQQQQQQPQQANPVNGSSLPTSNRFLAFRSSTSSFNELRNDVPPSSPRIERREPIDRSRDVKPTVQVHPFMNKDCAMWRNTSREPTCQPIPSSNYGSLKTMRCEESSDTPRRAELQRSSSQRDQKSPATTQRELLRYEDAINDDCDGDVSKLNSRAYSVKSRRDRNEYIGMDPLEINWSVRQLKTLFQDKRAPAINTDYNYPNF
ncbi:unnamed protein product [Auanema sp. JU1783]|nr:unnamed protein product [Auanema sp. JU1783]